MKGTGRKIVVVANVVRFITLLAGSVGAIVGIANLDWNFEESIVLLISSVVIMLIGYVNSILMQGFGEIVESLRVMTGVAISESKGDISNVLNKFMSSDTNKETEPANVEEILEDL